MASKVVATPAPDPVRLPLRITIGGQDDPMRDFPSTISARARRQYDATGVPLELLTYGHHVIEFVETHCVLTDSHFAGQPFKLMPWQQRLVLEMYIAVSYTHLTLPTID
jgi:hypothetical protein